uniref:Uncharacterized protein n=1 Tax=Glossina pallidipes TaxID=7398 RepID=A0A1B0AGJ6_GLOPL
MKPWGLLLLKLRNMCMLFSVVEGVCGGEVESSFFRLRFSGVASSGAESTSKSDSGELGGPVVFACQHLPGLSTSARSGEKPIDMRSARIRISLEKKVMNSFTEAMLACWMQHHHHRRHHNHHHHCFLNNKQIRKIGDVKPNAGRLLWRIPPPPPPPPTTMPPTPPPPPPHHHNYNYCHNNKNNSNNNNDDDDDNDNDNDDNNYNQPFLYFGI